MTLGKKIKDLRTNNNISQKNMASILGISVSALQKYEYGDLDIKSEILYKYCDYFGISLEEFLKNADINPDEKSLMLWDFENIKDLHEEYNSTIKEIKKLISMIDIELDEREKMLLYSIFLNTSVNLKVIDNNTVKIHVYSSDAIFYEKFNTQKDLILSSKEFEKFIFLVAMSLESNVISLLQMSNSEK
ncbi:helix-turn-helix domain-containing protein [Streptobacillus moniliformis]|uniref:helix-turn-helix domain-containing protein n=1 Tax=Streptobacillus moniliformis TaxID=34105 RepID=UPI0007E46AA8|nr:helix-turn-helix transcriptional regulator [Streptobacillus moniliformis]